ncbi:MAG: Gldg family protein [Lachnospiraceae bacterium]|nr:Gldg family protein [Lachnospiraceae bacterium]
MKAIFKREFRSYFNTVTGELFIGLNIIVFGFFFAQNNLLGLSNNLNGALYNTAFLGLVFMLPLLCMRSFSEERRQKTDQLIMTAPVSVGGIVMGKFLAIAAVFSIPTAVICILPPIMGRFGDVPYLWNYADILDYWLYGLMMISICIFISSLFDNQIISVVISVVLLLACNLMSNLFAGIKTEWIKDILNSTIDFSGRLLTIYLGSFDLTSIIFFASVTVLFLFLTSQVLQKRRFTVSRANLSVTAYSTAMIAVMIAVVVALNMVALQIPDNIREVDLTANRIYSIGDESKKIASAVTDDVTLYFLAQKNDEAMATKDQTVERILKSYTGAGGNIKLKYIDPVVNAKFYKKYTEQDPGYSGVIVVDETNGRSKAVPYSDMYQTQVDYQTYTEQTTGYDIEGQVTAAIQYVTLTDDQLVKAYLTSGHDELPLDQSFAKVLDNANITTDSLSLLTAESVPEDCELLMIIAPASDFTPSEADTVIKYLENGGDLLVVTNPDAMSASSMDNFKKILAWYSLELTDDIVIDYTNGHYYAAFGSPVYLLPTLMSGNEITGTLTNEGFGTVFLPEAQPVNGTSSDDLEITELLKTSDESFLSNESEESAEKQSYTVGIMAEKTLDSGTSKAAVYTSAYIFTDQVDELIGNMNQKLFSNTVSSMVELSADFVTIPAKSMESYLTIPMTVGNFLAVIGFALISAVAIIICGIAIWLVRRKK